MNEKKNPSFRIVSLGCRTNQYEGQAFHDQLGALGYKLAQEGDEADLCIVNTCTVTESADTSSRHEIRKLAKNNPNAKIYVTGCYAERDPDAVAALPGVTGVVRNADKEDLISKIFPDLETYPEFSIERFDAHTRAFVKVQDGCNSYCTYCIIPYVRGRSRSRDLADILEEVNRLVAQGFKEIVLTGINIGDFDGAVKEGETPVRLADLVRAVDQVEGVERIRVSSIDPDEVDEELASAILDSRKTCHSMHVVLQSGSNVILKKMNRKYTRQIFFETVQKLRSVDPDFTFTTDVIVGFPGETDADHQETLAVMREVQFAKVHMFPYSDRPRTRSALYPNKVTPQVIKERKQEVLREAEKLSFDLRQGYVGRKMTILTESREDERWITGHTDNFLPVIVDAPHLQPNTLVEVLLHENTAKGLIGVI